MSFLEPAVLCLLHGWLLAAAACSGGVCTVCRRLEQLLKRYERGELPHVSWLDQLALKQIEHLRHQVRGVRQGQPSYTLTLCNIAHLKPSVAASKLCDMTLPQLPDSLPRTVPQPAAMLPCRSCSSQQASLRRTSRWSCPPSSSLSCTLRLSSMPR